MSDDRFGTDTHSILGACIEVHRHLGPGLLEPAYEQCLAYELELRGLRFVRQPRVPLIYKGLRIEHAYPPDFIVEGRVIVEVKAVQGLLAVHKAQVGTYLRVADLQVGVLVNFDVPVLKDGIRRIISSSNSPSPRLPQ